LHGQVTRVRHGEAAEALMFLNAAVPLAEYL
jgi:hypothetical protein